jgi:hypothetical protein
LPKDFEDGDKGLTASEKKKKLLKMAYTKLLVREETLRIPIDMVWEVPRAMRQRTVISKPWVKKLKVRFLLHGKSPLGQPPGAMIVPPDEQPDPQSAVLLVCCFFFSNVI